MTLRKKIALFAASVAVIGAGTLAVTAQPASAAPLIASAHIVAAHNGNQGGSYGNGNQGGSYSNGDRGGSYSNGDRGSSYSNGDRGSSYSNGDRGRGDRRDFSRDRDDHRYFSRSDDRDFQHDRDYRHDQDRHESGPSLTIVL